MSRRRSIPKACTTSSPASPRPTRGENEVRLVQDAEIWAAKLDAGVEAIHPLAPGRKAWLQVAKGEVTLGEDTLQAGDAAAITDQDEIAVRSKPPAKCCCLIWCERQFFLSYLCAAITLISTFAPRRSFAT